MKDKEIKKEKLKVMDMAISTVKFQGKLKVGSPANKGKTCGWYSKEYAKGFNDMRKIALYNLKLDRQLIYHDVSCGYELSIKLASKQ